MLCNTTSGQVRCLGMHIKRDEICLDGYVVEI